MFEIIFELAHNILFGNPELAEVTWAIGPLAIAGIGAGISALGGIASSLANDSAQQRIPDALTQQIEDLRDPQFFRPLLQRVIQNDQGFANITQTLASQGVDSAAIANEQRQALENQRQDAVSGAVQRLEGTRISALNNALGQLNQINARNTQLRQQEVQNRLGIINQVTAGIGGSVTQGLGAKQAQGALDKALNNLESQPAPDLGSITTPGITGFGFGGGGFQFQSPFQSQNFRFQSPYQSPQFRFQSPFNPNFSPNRSGGPI